MNNTSPLLLLHLLLHYTICTTLQINILLVFIILSVLITLFVLNLLVVLVVDSLSHAYFPYALFWRVATSKKRGKHEQGQKRNLSNS